MSNKQNSRRQFLQQAVATGFTASILGNVGASAASFKPDDDFPPIRQITHGPNFHWFAYYDKLQFDPTSRFVLSNEVDFEHRSPAADDEIRIGLIDTQDNDRWTELGRTKAWCWQQGCMLQWRPGSDREVLWNDREGDRFVCRIMDVQSGEMRTIPHPIYTLSPCGKWGVTPDFRRINDMRPGYGYAGPTDPYADQLAPEASGIHRIDLDTGEATMLISLADVAAIPFAKYSLAEAKHYFNHLLISPDGARVEFLHRWRMEGLRSFGTRMMTIAADGSDIREIDPSGYTSHFIWRDPDHILAWSRHESHGDRFYLYEDREGGSVEAVGPDVMTRNGHCTYLPGNEWILNDSYPDGDRNQNPYLYEVATGRVVSLGHFRLPPEYTGEWRCDLHPRFSPCGKFVTIDSPHKGEGRQVHLIDISEIVEMKSE
jgi:hypothetical protein